MNNRELRAPRKKNFKLEYETVMNVLEELTDEELGEYFKAVCNYELFGVIPEDFSNRTVRAMFKVTCRELDYQMEKHKGNQDLSNVKNLDVRILVSESGLKYKAIADQMGISAEWLSKLMKHTLTAENKARIIAAINKLKEVEAKVR